MDEVKIKPVVNQQDAVKAIKASRDDGHFIISPTHIVEKAGDIIGSFSLIKNPACFFWMDSKKASIRDSLIAINVGENIARVQGEHILIAMSKDSSPFAKILNRIGYKPLDTMTLNYKILD